MATTSSSSLRESVARELSCSAWSSCARIDRPARQAVVNPNPGRGTPRNRRAVQVGSRGSSANAVPPKRLGREQLLSSFAHPRGQAHATNCEISRCRMREVDRPRQCRVAREFRDTKADTVTCASQENQMFVVLDVVFIS